MSTQRLSGSAAPGVFNEWAGSTTFNSGLRKSFPNTDPTFPSASAITQVQVQLFVNNPGDVDPAGAGLLGSGVNLAGAITLLSDFVVHSFDFNGPNDVIVARPGGGAWTYADLANVEAYSISHGGTNNTMTYNSSSVLVTFTLPAPTATTSAASGVTTSAAVLNGTINPNGGTATYPTSYFFQYGFTAAYGSVTATTGGQVGSSPIIVAVPLSGLVGNSTYHYRLVATNGDNTVLGSDLTFTTSPGDTVVIHL